MRKMLYIALNDIRMELSEKSTLVFFFILPVVFTIVIGTGLNGVMGGGDSSADQRLPLLIVDEDQSALSAQLVETIAASTVIRPLEKPATEAQRLFDEQQAPAVMTIPGGYEASLLAGKPVEVSLQKSPGSTEAQAIEAATRSAITQAGSAVAIALESVSQAEKLRPFQDAAAQKAYFEDSLASARQLLADPNARAQATQGEQTTVKIASGFEQSSAGQLVTWTLITLVAAAEVFVNERLSGTLRRLLITPTQKVTLITGKIAGRLSLGFIQMAVLIGFGALVMHVNWGRSPLALILIVVSFGLAAVSLGVLLGAFARTRSQAAGLTVMISMLTAALGGAWWPLDVTPPAYQAVVKILPTTWAMTGFTNAIVRGQDAAQVLPQAAALLGFAVVFFGVGIWRLRYE